MAKKAEKKPKTKTKVSAEVKLSEKVEQLPVVLTQDELLEFGQRLARIDADVAEHNAHAEAVKRELKSKEGALEAERARLAGIVRNRKEPRDVLVTCWKDMEGREYREVRKDTGEVVYSRPLRPDELQAELFHEEKQAEATEPEPKEA